jgi:hypothetical protein
MAVSAGRLNGYEEMTARSPLTVRLAVTPPLPPPLHCCYNASAPASSLPLSVVNHSRLIAVTLLLHCCYTVCTLLLIAATAANVYGHGPRVSIY